MTEIADTTSTTAETQEAAPAGAAPEAPRSVEEVEAIYQKRLSGKDKAHNAEVAELRRQLESARTNGTGSTSAPGETPEQARIRELEELVQRSTRATAVAERKARFPHAAEDLGDDIATIDEARLARLETRLAAEEAAPPPRMDPNSAPRTAPSATKTLDDMSVDELKAQLKAISPAYEEYLRSIR